MTTSSSPTQTFTVSPDMCTVCKSHNTKLTKIRSTKADSHYSNLCGKCRNGHYTYVNIFFKKLVESRSEIHTQSDLNLFTFKFLESKINCKRRSNFADFSKICPMIPVSPGGSRMKQCLICRFRRTIFLFNPPKLTIMKKEDETRIFHKKITCFWGGLIEFLLGIHSGPEWSFMVKMKP